MSAAPTFLSGRAQATSLCVCNFVIKGPGDYLIAATYDNPVPPHLAPEGIKLWGRIDEELHTKRVKFKVIE
jgi:hypothetical protein